MKKPMSDEQASAHARRVLKEHQKRLNPRAVRSDAEAFDKIKGTGKVKDLAKQIQESFEQNQRSTHGR